VNRQPLNVELLTLDDGSQKIAWDVKHLQSLLGITDLIHQEELNSSESTTTGVNASGIPTIETVIAILDELGLKDLYEVRYRKQYATIIPKTDSKRPKVAMYVVQRESEIALSIHNRIWNNHQVKIHWNNYHDGTYNHLSKVHLYIPESDKRDFIGRLIEATSGDTETIFAGFEENFYTLSKSYELPHIDYDFLIYDMSEQGICYHLSSDQRFPSTSRILLSQPSELKSLLLELMDNIHVFLHSNGEKLEVQFNDDDEPVEPVEPVDDF